MPLYFITKSMTAYLRVDCEDEEETPPRVDLSVINGRVVVENGELTTVELAPVIERHNRIAKEMVERAGAK